MVQTKRVEFVSAKKLQSHIYYDEKFSSFDEKLHLWFDIGNFSFSFHQRMDWAYQQMRLVVKWASEQRQPRPGQLYTAIAVLDEQYNWAVQIPASKCIQ